MIKWFYRWLGNKIVNTMREHDEEPQTEAVPVAMIGAKARRRSTVRESDDFSTEPIQFKMYKASGGWAIEFRQYDHKADRIDTSLYVVNGEEELGKHISQIITMEALKR